jgi:hypothetical protein
MMEKNITLGFVGADTYDPILNTGLFPPNQVREVVNAADNHLCTLASRVLTVKLDGLIISNETDENYETTSASGSLRTLAELHKAGVIRIASINSIPVAPKS